MPLQLLNVSDYEARAREILPATMWGRMYGTYGAPDWLSNTANVAAFDAIKLRPRILTGGSRRELSTEALGLNLSFPVMLAPADHHTRAHPHGELASAKAAGGAGTAASIATLSGYSIEEVAEAATGPVFFQLYFLRDRRLDENLVRRAEQAGYKALILTVDTIAGYWRERELRYGAYTEAELRSRNFVGIEGITPPRLDVFPQEWEQDMSWADVQWLRSITSMPLVIKGVQTAEDARLCVENGVDAIVVSNHGGHAAQGTLGTIEMLPEIVDAVGGRLEVFLDGGARKGTDVLKALVLGAKAVFIGRPMFWGLAVDGEAGVAHVLRILREELDVAMALCGVTDVKALDRSLVLTPDERGGDSVVGQLERLAALVERGYLTREEFEGQKARLLAG